MRRLAASTLALLCLPALAALAGADPEALPVRGEPLPPSRVEAEPLWRQPSRWRQLERGMTRFQVMRLLGEPGKVSRYYALERWEYPRALGGRVIFDAAGRTSNWKAPRSMRAARSP